MHLKEYLYHKEIKITDFAKEIDYNRLHIGLVAKGKLKPGPKLIKKLIEYTEGIITEEDLLKFYKEKTKGLKKINKQKTL